MNLKKKIKAFFTLTRKTNCGFTLVELIVVIAILAVLAGVAVPAYSGYVEKANKQADMTLVSEVIQALEMGFYSGTLAAPGYVILYTDADATFDGEETNGINQINTAMASVFGDNWKTTLRLKSDDWTDTDLLTEAANNAYAASIPVSTYITDIGTDKVLGDVQNCATKFSEFLTLYEGGNKDAAVAALKDKMGEDVVNGILAEAGYEDGDYSDITSEELANLTVFGVANNVKTNSDAVIAGFSNPTGGFLKNNLPLGADSSLEDVANWYAAGEALVAYLGNEHCTELFENIDMTGNAGAIAISMRTAYENITSYVFSDEELTERCNAYYTPGADNESQAMKDGKAYVGIMSTVNNLRDDYTEDNSAMKDSQLFVSGAISDRVNGFVTATEMIAEMGTDIADIFEGIEGSAVIVFANTDGSAISVNAISDDADPRS